MAGHSKWANIQHRKNRQDAKRGSLWTRIIREVTVAARDGGSDPDMNPRLRLALDKARLGNVPKDKLQAAIQRGSGRLEGVNYEDIRYEGYGIGGAAVNRRRGAARARQAWRQPRHRRLGRLHVQALRPVSVRTGHGRRQGDGSSAGGRCRGRADQ
jgi:transcriptional/translational regulatory protein YebC/TACO1